MNCTSCGSEVELIMAATRDEVTERIRNTPTGSQVIKEIKQRRIKVAYCSDEGCTSVQEVA